MEYYCAVRHVRILGHVCPQAQIAAARAAALPPRQLPHYLPPISLPALLHACQASVFGMQTAPQVALQQAGKRPRSPSAAQIAPQGLRSLVQRSKAACPASPNRSPADLKAASGRNVERTDALDDDAMEGTEQPAAHVESGTWVSQSQRVDARSRSKPGEQMQCCHLWSRARELGDSVAASGNRQTDNGPLRHIGDCDTANVAQQSGASRRQTCAAGESAVAITRPAFDTAAVHIVPHALARKLTRRLWLARHAPANELRERVSEAKMQEGCAALAGGKRFMTVSHLFGAVHNPPVEVPML
jgi:hypothetical protein